MNKIFKYLCIGIAAILLLVAYFFPVIQEKVIVLDPEKKEPDFNADGAQPPIEKKVEPLVNS